MGAYNPERQVQLAQVAARQWGVVTRAQLRGVGFTDDEVKRAVAAKRLLRMYRGVYVLGALSAAPEQRFAAALLAAGKGAVLCNSAATAMFGWTEPKLPVEVAVPKQR